MRALNIPAENLSIAYDVKDKYLGRASEEPPMEAKIQNSMGNRVKTSTNYCSKDVDDIYQMKFIHPIWF